MADEKPLHPDTCFGAPELISVIMPARNVERFVVPAIQSALAQTYWPIEVIVVDDGSTDQTASQIERIARSDPRVTLLRSSRVGPSASRNLAIEHAKGQLVAPLDADDLWHPEKLARQCHLMGESPPSVGVVYCWSRGIDEFDRVIMPSWNASPASGAVLPQIVVTGLLGNGSTPLIRRAAIEAIGGYDPELHVGEDWKFYIALAGECEFAVVPAYLTGYRFRPGSASTDVPSIEKAMEQVTDWISRKWPSLPGDWLVDRRASNDAYLAFLEIRERHFVRAARLLLRCLRARPGRAMSASFLKLLLLWAAHAAGLRVYRSDFWQVPRSFREVEPWS
jgi:glycosyltransferase involved in cell wall biosynthesis